MKQWNGDMKVSCVGLDAHYKFSSVTMRNAAGQVVRRERLEHEDRAALRKRLASWPKGVVVVEEASFGWGWLCEELSAAGLRPRLSNCYKVEQMRKACGWVKTNKKDADLLSLLPGEPDEWWRIWLAPPEVRDRREWMRYRSDLVGVQTATKSRICAVFHRHGIFHDFSDLFGGKGRAFLAELCRDCRVEEWNDVSGDAAVAAGRRQAGCSVASRANGKVSRQHSFGNGPALSPYGPCRQGLRPPRN